MVFDLGCPLEFSLDLIGAGHERRSSPNVLILLEAMKMEIPVLAPCSGTVRTILVKEKDEVAEGQPLAVLRF